MALQDILGTPDKVEKSSDITQIPRGAYTWNGSAFVYLPVGTVKRTETRTTSIWTAATRQACLDYEETYSGSGSIDITQENKVVNSWQLVLVETSVSVSFTAAT